MPKPIKEISFIPIHVGFDYSTRPIGYTDTTDGNVILKLNDKEQITVEDVNSGKVVFAPSYLIVKEENGIVKQISVESFSLLRQK
jgi:hypothetical protein